MVTITLQLPDEVRQALDEIAERTGRSRTDLIHDAVRDYLVYSDQVRDDPGLPRSAGMIEDAGVTAEGFEDWLKANWRPEEDWGRT
jgi:predicted transcriptional regulator